MSHSGGKLRQSVVRERQAINAKLEKVRKFRNRKEELGIIST